MIRTDPVVWLSACALLAASAASAFQIVPIPVPRDAQGRPVAIEQAAFHGQDLLVLLDTAGKVYETRDTGRTWNPVTVPAGARLEFFGQMLQTREDSLQYRNGRWVRLQAPFEGISCGSRWANSDGYAACVDQATGDVVFVRSIDTLLTWNAWFRVSSATLAGFDLSATDEIGADAGGRMWWQVRNTTTLRGTSDGRNWIDVPGPALDGLYPKFAIGDTMYIRGTNSEGVRLGLITTDLGRHWDSVPPTEPGGTMIIRLAPGKWLAASQDAQTDLEHIHLGPTFRGPWERLPDSTNRITISSHHDLLIATPGTLAWIAPGTSAISRTPSLRSRTAYLRVDEAGWNVVWPAGAEEGAWRLVGADGKRLSSGHVSRGQKELALPRVPQACWLVLPGSGEPLAVPAMGAR